MTAMESWLCFDGTVMEKNMERDKQKCAGTDTHAGMRFIIRLRLLSLQSASLCSTSLDRLQFGPLGRKVIKNDGPHT